MMTDTRRWTARLASHAVADDRRAILELWLTLALFVGSWLLAWAASLISPWLALAFAPLTGLFLVRLFIIQHDCGHGSLFSSRAANEWIGRALGVLTFTPYDVWKHAHALHHASSGNLDKRGHGDIDTLTVAEYRALSSFGRMKYRLYRHPVVMFGIGPAYMFLLQHRLPVGYMRDGALPWLSAMGTNLGMLAVGAAVVAVFGWQALLVVHLPAAVAGAAIGVWLFYVQHQFEPTFWARAPEWKREEAALHGSSYYDLPRPLMWLTGNIGIHHVHHLASRIPFHRLPGVLQAHPELGDTNGRLTLRGSLACVRLTLWDEQAKRMVTFRQAALA